MQDMLWFQWYLLLLALLHIIIENDELRLERYNYKKRVVLWLAVSAIIMLVLPWLAVTFVKGDAGMAVCFLLFYAINPIYSIIIGAIAGKDIKHLCSLPFISSILYLFGVWIFLIWEKPHLSCMQ